MRGKSFPNRSSNKSSRKSLDPYSSPAPLPVTLQDEAGEKYGSGVHSSRCDPQCESGNVDVEIVPDTFDETSVPVKKRHRLVTSESGKGGSDSLNFDACIVCDTSDKWVSRCSGVDCLLSFHGECLDAEFDSSEDLANPYCHYCWFKILALKSKPLREKTIGAEKAVSKYLNKEIKRRDEVKESVRKSQDDTILFVDENGNKEHSMESTDIVSDQELQEEKDDCSSKEEHVEKDSDISRGEDMPLNKETDPAEEDNRKLEVGTDKSGYMEEDRVRDEVEASEEERVATEDFQDAEDEKDNETANYQTKITSGAGKKGEVSPFLSMQESFSGSEQNQAQQNVKQRRSRRRRIQLKTLDSDISSNESTNERNGEYVTEQISSSNQVTSPVPKMKSKQKEIRATTNVTKSKTVRDISFFKRDQRRRLFWTFEEEEMLKVGVEKFAVEANKNMPWRKILEMGEKVFHETRIPADLKDKWRNMIWRKAKNTQNRTLTPGM